MGTKHDFVVKNGLQVGKSLTVDSDVNISGTLNVTGSVTGSYAGFDSDFNAAFTPAFDSAFNAALDSAGVDGTGLSYNSTTNTLSISNTGVTAGTYGSASLVPVLSVNAQGQIDSAGTVSVAGVSSTAFDSASHTLTINTADGGSFNQIVQTKMPGTAGSYGSAALVPVVTVNEYGLVDSINEVSVAGVSTFDFDSATGKLTIGTADGGSFSQVTTLDPYTTSDVTFGSVTADSAILSQVSFSTSNAHLNYEEGAVWYDTTHKTLNYWGDDSAVIHEIGIEEHQRVYNNSGSTITKGTPLYYAGNYDPGGTPAVPTVGKADATDVNAYNAQGLAAGDIPNNSYGYVILSGLVEDINTSALNAGENFFVGLTPGAVQNQSPLYPNYPMCLGWVVKSDATNGSLLVNQQNHSVNSFRVRTSAHVGEDLIVGGNLTVTGTQTITSTENVQIGGNIQYLNAGDTIGEANTTFVGTGLDDAFFSGHYNGDSSSKSFYVKIDATGTPDTFEWGFDSSVGTEATGISITGNDQLLDSAYGINIKFSATTGHTTGDKWTGTASAVDTDTGFFSNRNTGDAGNGYTHVGLFFDASEDTWRLLSAYDSEPEAPININSPSLTYGDLRAGTVTASALTANGNITVTGTVDGRDIATDGGKLDGIEAGATGDQTASEILTAIKTVDGASSGLDADQLDGLEASQFLRSDASDDMTGTLTVSGNLGVGNTSPQNKLTVNTPQRNDSGTNSLGAAVVAGPISNPPTHDFSNSNAIFRIQGSNATNNLQFGVGDAGYNYHPWIQGSYDNTTGADNFGSKDLLLQPIGGAVGIGTNSPAYKTHSAIDYAGNNYLGDPSIYAMGITNEDTTATNAVAMAFGHGTYDYTHYIASIRKSSGANPWGDLSIGGRPSDAAGFVDRIYLQGNTGNVGIGTTTPSNQLEITGGTNKAVISVTNADLGSLHYTDRNGRYLTSNGSGWTSGVDGADPGIVIGSDNSSGQIKGVGIVLHNDNNSDNQYSPTISFGNKSNSGSYNTTYAHIIGRKTGQAADANWSAGELGFYTQPVGGYVTNTPRLLINSAGNVGIGTSSPEGHLDINISGVNDTQAVDWTNSTAAYTTQTGGTLRNIILSNRHGATKHTFYGYTGPTLEFRNANASYEWEAGKIMGVVDPMNTTNYKGGLVFFANSDGNTSNNPAGRMQNGADSVVHMALGDKRVYIPYTMNIGDYTSTHNYDLNNRPQIKLEGAYPHLFLIDDTNNNTTHGPVISMGGFVGSVQRRWNIGVAANNPSNLSIGYYDNQPNPHYGTGTGWGSDAFTRFSVYTDRTEAKGSMRSSIFYDLDNTSYYVNPNGTSSMYNVNIRGDVASTATDNQIFFWSNGNTTTSAIGFKSNGGNFGNPTGNGDGYNTYLTMDTDGRGWVFRRGTGGTNFTAAYTSGWILNNGVWQANASMRSPIFYDSGNTGYYFDGSATGDSIRVAGDIVAYYSDARLKDFQGRINGALDKVLKINGYYYTENEKAKELGYNTGRTQVGVSAQEIEEVLPEVIKDAPIGHGYKTVQYERLVPLLIEAIKEQNDKIDRLEAMVEKLINTNKG